LVIRFPHPGTGDPARRSVATRPERLRPPIAKYAELLKQNSVFTKTFGLV
jgi:hypothetical protein